MAGTNAATEDPDFARFWAAYPRKQAKRDAEKAWMRLKPSPELVEVMLAAIAAQSGSDQWRRGFIPHPATWLNGQRWEDQPVPIASGKPTPAEASAAARAKHEERERARLAEANS